MQMFMFGLHVKGQEHGGLNVVTNLMDRLNRKFPCREIFFFKDNFSFNRTFLMEISMFSTG